MLLFWVFFYGLLYTAAEAATPLAGNSLWLTPLVMLGYVLILLGVLVHAGQLKNMGLLLPRLPVKRDLIYLIPTLLLPAWNLSGSAELIPPHGMLLMLSICFAEELLFRGYLLSVLIRRHGKWGILWTSLAFSLLHSANLLSGAPLSYVLIQMLLAFFVGIYYSLSRIYFSSLYPCIAAHFLTNITAHSGTTLPEHQLILILALSCSGWLLYSKISSDLEDVS